MCTIKCTTKASLRVPLSAPSSAPSRLSSRKSTQGTNFQSISYFAYSYMKLTVIYVKVVKYFSLWHNFILNVPTSSAQKLLPGKVPARIKNFQKWQISTNTLLTIIKMMLFKTVFYCVCLLILETICIKFYKRKVNMKHT